MPDFGMAYRALSVLGIRDAGDIDRERVVLRVDKPVDLLEYLVLNAASSHPARIRDLNQHVFWFPSHEVKPGEFVRLYSRTGVQLTRLGSYGRSQARYHDFFWGKSTPVWMPGSNAAVLIEIAGWRFAVL
jgi:hypothetical protein